MQIRRITVIVLLLFLMALSGSVMADSVRVISYGADLTNEQREKVYGIFGLKEADKQNIAVTGVSNEEERDYLEGLVESDIIGEKAISCAYVELLGDGAGITVQTNNITWVTPEMYASALTTAQVKDAKVIAAAPFPVSGTAALTGIFKAFEAATGKSLDREAKGVANEEMVRTGEIGKSIDDNQKATDLIMRIKEEIVRRNLSDPEEIRQVIINISNELNINLTDEQIEQLISLMQKIKKLNLNVSEINTQLKDIRSKLDNLAAQGEGIKGFLQRIIDFLAQIVNSIKSLFG
ncbi:MAG: DUF1002 domain-containing protein [Dehalobacterium sp.]